MASQVVGSISSLAGQWTRQEFLTSGLAYDIRLPCPMAIRVK